MYPALLQALLATVALVPQVLSNPIAPLPNHQHFTVHGGSPANHTSGLLPHMATTNFNRRSQALGVYECAGSPWTPPCSWIHSYGSECHNVVYANDFSIGPDEGLTCTVYGARDCLLSAEMSNDFVWPGVTKFDTNQWWQSLLTGNNKNAKLLSYKCFVLS